MVDLRAPYTHPVAHFERIPSTRSVSIDIAARVCGNPLQLRHTVAKDQGTPVVWIMGDDVVEMVVVVVTPVPAARVKRLVIEGRRVGRRPPRRRRQPRGPASAGLGRRGMATRNVADRVSLEPFGDGLGVFRHDAPGRRIIRCLRIEPRDVRSRDRPGGSDRRHRR